MELNTSATITSGDGGEAAPGAVGASRSRRRGKSTAAVKSSNGYGTTIFTGAHAEFRERLKDVLRKVGLDLKPVALVLTHQQLVPPSAGVSAEEAAHVVTDQDLIMEDVHHLLLTGEVPGLFERDALDASADEVANIVKAIREQADKANTDEAARQLAAAGHSVDATAGVMLASSFEDEPAAASAASDDDALDKAVGTAAPTQARARPATASAAAAAAALGAAVTDPAYDALLRASSREECWGLFLARVRSMLHVILNVSAVGDGLRRRLRAYPSMLSECWWDWYHDWSSDALLAVSYKRMQRLTFGVPTAFMAKMTGASSDSSPTSFQRSAAALLGRAGTKRRLSITVPGAPATTPADEADGKLRASLAYAAMNVYLTVPAAAAAYASATRREVHVTPKLFLEFLDTYARTWSAKRSRVITLLDRLANGIATLEATNALVASLKDQLTALQPVLAQKRSEVAALLEEVGRQRVDAEAVATKVAEEEAEVSAQADAAAELQAEAQTDLDAAMPALEAAVSALDALEKKDVNEMKSYNVPPPAVRTVMEAVCVLLGRETDWETAKRVLGSDKPTFRDMLLTFDKDGVSTSTLKRLARYTSAPTMTVDAVRKVSIAAAGICMWVHAVEQYSKVAREVAPKQARLTEMSNNLASANAALTAKRADLASTQERLAQLQMRADAATAEKDRLERESTTAQLRLTRANQLVQGLGEEGTRWRADVVRLNKEATTLIGDVFLSTASVVFSGAFSGEWRARIMRTWVRIVQAFEQDADRGSMLAIAPPTALRSVLSRIPFSPAYAVRTTLGDEVTIRDWQAHGLPKDTVSVDNALLVTYGAGVHLSAGMEGGGGRRWPLCIDPQGQAEKWIIAMEGGVRTGGAGATAAAAATASVAGATATAGARPAQPSTSSTAPKFAAPVPPLNTSGPGIGRVPSFRTGRTNVTVVPLATTGAAAAAAQASAEVAAASRAGIEVVSIHAATLLRTIESCVRTGRALMIKDCPGSLPSLLDPVLSRALFRAGGRQLMRFCAKDIDYDDGFRLFLVCSSANERIAPDLAVRVNVVDFTVSRPGLEEQLLSAVVAHDRPMVETKAAQLVLSLASDKKQLATLEDTVLALLAGQSTKASGASTARLDEPGTARDSGTITTRGGSATAAAAAAASTNDAEEDSMSALHAILDDTALITALQTSRTVAGIITERVADSERNATALASIRELFRPVAHRGALLFFVVSDLAGVDPMYVYSLPYFMSLFQRSLREAGASLPPASTTSVAPPTQQEQRALAERSTTVMKHITALTYQDVCRGLFLRHRLTFAFMTAAAMHIDTLSHHAGGAKDGSTQLQLSSPSLPEFHLLLHGPAATVDSALFAGGATRRTARASTVAPASDSPSTDTPRGFELAGIQNAELRGSVTASGWALLVQASSSVPGLRDVAAHVQEHWSEWREWLQLANPFEAKGPKSWLPLLTDFQRMLLLRCMAPHKLLAAVTSYVRARLGDEFVNVPPTTMADVYSAMTPSVPALLLLSQGFDPTEEVIRFAEAVGVRPRASGSTPGADAPGGSSSLPQLAQASTRDRLQILSMGQGQAAKADALIAAAAVRGDWVLLQNCHLATSWLPTLSRTLSAIAERPLRDIAAETAAVAGTARAGPAVSPRSGMGTTSRGAGASPRSLLSPTGAAASSRRASLEDIDEQLMLESASKPVSRGSMGAGELDVGPPPTSLLHPDFRIFITTAPTPDFPIVILQNAVKWTSEAPQGLKANLQRTLDSFVRPATRAAADGAASHAAAEATDAEKRNRRRSVKQTSSSDSGAATPMQLGRTQAVSVTSQAWVRLSFALAHFHALLLERRRYGALGFASRYEFSDGDAETALGTMRMLLQAEEGRDVFGVVLGPARRLRSSPTEEISSSPAIRGGESPMLRSSPSLVSSAGESTARLALEEAPSGAGLAARTWAALRYMVADITYGGRVVDRFDQRCISTLLDFVTWNCRDDTTPLSDTAPAGQDASAAWAVRTMLDQIPALQLPREGADGSVTLTSGVDASLQLAVSQFGTDAHLLATEAGALGLHSNAEIRQLRDEARVLLSSCAGASVLHQHVGPSGAGLQAALGSRVASAPRQADLPRQASASTGPPTRGRRDSLLERASAVQKSLRRFVAGPSDSEAAPASAEATPVPAAGGAASGAPADAIVQSIAESMWLQLPASLPVRPLVSAAPTVPGADKPAAALVSSDSAASALLTMRTARPASPRTSRVGSSMGGGPRSARASAMDVEPDVDVRAAASVSPFSVVLQHEVIAYNVLLDTVRRSLQLLIRALRGMAAMDAATDLLYSALAENRVPAAWKAVSFASVKPLAAWFGDLVVHAMYFERWTRMKPGTCPPFFPLHAFMHPQGLLTASLQAFARSSDAPITDVAHINMVVAEEEWSEMQELWDETDGFDAPEVSTGVHPAGTIVLSGLHLEGACWDATDGALAEALPGQVYAPCPAVRFLPVLKADERVAAMHAESYECPVYQTPARRSGAAATGGHIGSVFLPLRKTAEQRAHAESTATSTDLTSPGAARVSHDTLSRALAHSVSGIQEITLPAPRAAPTSAQMFVLRGTAAICSLED